MKTCKKHIKDPVICYSDCAGCEMQRLADERDQLKAENEALHEMLSKQVYERWSGEAGYVPWVRRGNSLRQDEARRIARALMSKEG